MHEIRPTRPEHLSILSDDAFAAQLRALHDRAMHVSAYLSHVVGPDGAPVIALAGAPTLDSFRGHLRHLHDRYGDRPPGCLGGWQLFANAGCFLAVVDLIWKPPVAYRAEVVFDVAEMAPALVTALACNGSIVLATGEYAPDRNAFGVRTDAGSLASIVQAYVLAMMGLPNPDLESVTPPRSEN